MRDESHFNTEHKSLAREGRRAGKNFMTFSFIGSISYIPVTERFTWQSFLVLGILVNCCLCLASYGTNKMHCFSSTYWCQCSLGPVTVSINLLF